MNSNLRRLHKLGLLGVGNYTLNLITLHTCGNVTEGVVVVKRAREREWTVNKLAFKQDNLGLRVLGAKQNTAMENWYKLLTHGSKQESLNWRGKARGERRELFN